MKKIQVTEPFLPPKEIYQSYLNGIWDRNWLTNMGPLSQEFEQAIRQYLGVSNFQFLGNGTIALQIAIKALGLLGEVITTPFSYVATTSSIVWENCVPIFVDIDPFSLNLDPGKIEKAITSKTSAILATHVYGNPCDIESIQQIAEKNGLKVIYDGAHCFGTKYKGKSVFGFGDVSTVSFHATKLFHTIEGGGVFTNDSSLNYRMSRLKNFGHAGTENYDGIGINGKNSEFHAAMGLANINFISEILAKRKEDYQLYSELLNHSKLRQLDINKDADFNYAYFPLIFSSEEDLLLSMQTLADHNILTRRYFHPLLSTLDYVKNSPCPIAESIANRVLCLPMSDKIQPYDIKRICDIINQNTYE